MKYVLDVRYSAMDCWTELEFDNEKDYHSEIIYKVEQGWQVKKSDKSQDIE
jgi:hypothetical protein